jgi:hypothetical protein
VAECYGSLHVLRARLTRLAADGTPDEGANGSYVTAHPMRIGFNPEIEEGADLVQKNGADCVCLSYKGPDAVKRWNLELDNCRIEPPALEMMVGAEVIPGAGEGEILGVVFPSGVVDCVDAAAGVALEVWTRAWDGDRPASATPYHRWVFPKTVWQLGDNEAGPEFMTVSMTGFTENNPSLGDPYGDMPAGFTNTGGGIAVFLDAGPLPTAACDYSAVGSGS